MRRVVLAALLFLLVSVALRADQWALPERRSFESSDGRWRLVVIPRRVESQLAYFTDKVEGTLTAVADNHARAKLYRRKGGMWRLAQRWTLVNDVSPVTALVAMDGTVVTFDNWHGTGYGDDVVVIYRPNGELVAKHALSDLLEEADIEQLGHSTSSIHWSGKHRIDEQQRSVVLQVKATKMEEFPVSLDTGALLVPKRDVFPRPKVRWTGEILKVAQCCDGAYALSGDELVQQAAAAPLPAYPDIARRAHIGGDVVLEIIVDENGDVLETKVLQPMPFGGTQAARDAVKQWKFRPLERDGKRVKMYGMVRMTFDLKHF